MIISCHSFSRNTNKAVNFYSFAVLFGKEGQQDAAEGAETDRGGPGAGGAAASGGVAAPAGATPSPGKQSSSGERKNKKESKDKDKCVIL